MREAAPRADTIQAAEVRCGRIRHLHREQGIVWPCEVEEAGALRGNHGAACIPCLEKRGIPWILRRMILNDRQITEHAAEGMISPFEPTLVRSLEDGTQVLSFGLSSFGYDLRLSAKEFKVFRHIPGTVVDPKKFQPRNLERVALESDAGGAFFILPARSYGLGVAVEKLSLPPDVTAICVGKSTYARCGIIANVTPAEAGWSGHLTLEFSNSSAADCRIYAGEGIVQMLFFRGAPCGTSYLKRAGKYQGQKQRITLPRV
jgi:dCTP deaminase